MRKIVAILGACAIAQTPAISLAAPGTPSGQANGWVHLNGPDLGTTGKPIESCEDLGTTPGNSAADHGNPNMNGSPFSGEDSVSGSHYAGTQPQNTRNFQSFSAYDVACANQPQ